MRAPERGAGGHDPLDAIQNEAEKAAFLMKSRSVVQRRRNGFGKA
ncbi:hypothetical protein [Allosphingosinicella vermicomposti]|nr:hypothetical protein [Allosphingosinicella vermicomposti]